ncbi:hypothetical protein FZEAL_930 [Fusarium zealandicum]|uniref:Secreted protein n=1 Tax=Fusarium zealandicum TaxID=1053134 RepID=A0A8H4UUJ1_9HYPO|nr:hypothetical protein FZEAL_930 [Fusarium zealandicum]
MLSKTSLLSLLLPVASAAVSSPASTPSAQSKPCQLLSTNTTQPYNGNQTQPLDPTGPTNQTQPGNGTDLPPDDTWVPTCKLPRTDVTYSVGHGFPGDCVPGTGTIQGFMIFVDFSDAESPDFETPGELRDLLVPEAAEWYKNASYGQLELNITADVSKFYRMPNSAESYNWEAGFSNAQHYAYVEDALDAYMNNGENPPPAATDVLYIATTRYNEWMSRSLGSGFSAWTRDFTFVAKRAVTFGNDPYLNWGYKAVNHETGHTMCLPDYYPGSSDLPTGYYTGGWSIMGSVGGMAPDFFAWDKWRLGWLADDAIDCILEHGTTEHTLTPLEVEGGVKAVVIAASQTSAIVAEARTAQGVDDQMCAPGVLLYTVDTTLTTSEGSVRVLDANPGSDGCGNNPWEPLDDGTLSMSGKRSFEASGWGVTVTLVDDKNGEFKIQVEYS